MPRIRADDYHDKKNAILDAAATLFAHHAYSGCKMQDIADACNVTKSMLYHYFSKKEDVLYEILRQHLLRILSSLKEYHATAVAQQPDIDSYFQNYIETYLEKSDTARAGHVVALHDMRYLTTQQQRKIKALEREVLDDVGAVLRKVNGKSTDVEYRAYSLLLIGMINWVELWYHRSGKMSPKQLYTMVTRVFLHGFA